MAAQRAKYGTILRSKGFIWLAGRDDISGEVGEAGAVLQLRCGGPWMGLMPEELWPEEGSDERDMIERDMAGPVLLDRRQELVFIGQNLNETAITTALNDCLVTRAEASRARAAAGGRDESLVEIDSLLNDLQMSSRKKSDEMGKVDLILQKLIESKKITKK